MTCLTLKNNNYFTVDGLGYSLHADVIFLFIKAQTI